MKRVLGVAGAALLLMTAAMGAWQGAGADRLNARNVRGAAGPQPRTRSGHRPHPGRRDRSEESRRLVRRVGVRRAVENGESRHHIRADLPEDRRGRRRSISAASSSIPRTRTSCGSAPARTRASAARISAPASTSRPTPARPGSLSGLRELRAHRQDRDRPAQLERGLRRGAGPAVLRGRRARRLQDDGRRRDVEPRAARQRRHRLHRRRVRSEESGHHVRGHVSAPASRRPDDRRRSGRRHLEDDQRRQELDEADQRTAARRSRPHRAGGGSQEARTGVCADRREDRRRWRGRWRTWRRRRCGSGGSGSAGGRRSGSRRRARGELQAGQPRRRARRR